MMGVKMRLFSLTVRGNTFEFYTARLNQRSFRFYRTKHVNAKSAFYRPVKWEWGLELGRKSYAIHYKQDL